ncbi:unnamed protein product [Clonostachys rhizophaga]|uniref:FAD dependent oxidoreductase domain-containing protein n=1 Tax=Clonostachys rhizophaga TaxID=160324 RepID=A0A9N9VIN9_9HYPO|nr:unnamed protein product [Clonostachys rhizophaga]
MAHIIVLGAGVIGLQTSLGLLKKKYRVTLVSSHWPASDSDDAYYTSMHSGAQWRSNPAAEDVEAQSWDRATLEHWRELIEAHSPQEIGLERLPARFLWDSRLEHALEHEHWWSEQKVVPIREINDPPAGFAAGFEYETIAVNPIIYCQYLLRECKRLGAETRTLRVNSLLEAFDAVPGGQVVFNCTGVAAGPMTGDKACFPTMGQLVLVRGRANRISPRRNIDEPEPWEALVFPRPGEDVTVLGGCKIPDSWETEPSDEITRRIMERCHSMAPELLDEQGNFTVVKATVGLRPSRNGGPRVEKEDLGNSRLVIHNYGHHSAGFEGCVGAAEAGISLLRKHLSSP